MYSYDFEFYKPGKKYFEGKEIRKTLDILQEHGYKISPVGEVDPHFKDGKFTFGEQETHLCFDLEKDGHVFFLSLGKADGPNGMIGLLSVLEDHELNENPEPVTQLFYEAAVTVSLGIEPYFAWGDHELELDKLSFFLDFEKNRIGAVAWMNFFSREYLEKLGGPEKVLLYPDHRIEMAYSFSKELGKYMFAPVALGPTPDKPTDYITAYECRRRYPDAILRSFEIIPKKAIEAID